MLGYGTAQAEQFNAETRCAKNPVLEEDLEDLAVNNKWVVSNIVDHVIAHFNASACSTVLATNILLEWNLFPCRTWAPNLNKHRQDHDPVAMGTRWRQRWTPELEHLLMLVNIGNKHWCLLVINLRSGSVELWDSLRSPGGNMPKQIDQQRLQAFMSVFSPATPELHFKIVQVPQQTGSNCGIFMLEFVRAFINGQRDGSTVEVREERMVEFRARLVEELRGIMASTISRTRIRIKPLEVTSNIVDMLASPDVSKKAKVVEEVVKVGLVEAEVKRAKAESASTWVVLESPNGVLSNGSLTFAKKSKAEWKCATRGSVGWDAGVHEWDVHLDKIAEGISVGVCRGEIDFKDANENVNSRFDLFCGKGCIVDIEDQVHSYFTKRAMQKARFVSVCLDLDKRTLAFGLDGVMKSPPAFSKLGKSTWYPYFALRDKGCTFTVLKK